MGGEPDRVLLARANTDWNRIQVLDYELSDLRRRYTTDDDAAGALFWRSVAEDALTLVGADFREVVEG